MTTAVASGILELGLRALWLTETYPPSRGGMAQSCDRIVRGLRRRGVTIDVLHFTGGGRPIHGRPWMIETQTGGRYLACPVEDDPAHALNRAWSTLTSDPATRGITHVVAFGGSRPVTAGPVYASWLNVPLLTLIRGNDFDAAVFSTRRRPTLDDALSRSALVCAVSQDKVDKIAAMHPSVPVRRIPNGIDLRDWSFAPSDQERASQWRQAQPAPGARVVGLFGQLKAKKGGLFLLESLRRSGAADALHLLVVGWIEPEMKQWLGYRGDSVSYTALPFLDRFELLPWYAACDWIAIPSFYDGMPNVLVEAAALGIPLLAARTGGMADVLEHDRTALLFEPGDEAGCSWALQRAAAIDARGREAMAEACKQLAVQELDADLETDRYVEALVDSRTDRSPADAQSALAAHG
jgi:glycosyltransferase involved in cell wall biosynthesis